MVNEARETLGLTLGGDTYIALVALVAAAPAVAAEAAPAPRWSIRGGLGAIGELLLVSPRQGDLFLLTDCTSIPVATAFLERRLGERSWLVLGAAGNLLRESFDAPPGEELTAPIRFAGGLALRISTSLADFSWSALERERGA